MKSKTITDAALRANLRDLLELPVARSTASPRPGGLLTGRVEDTHNPDLPGRVFVRWIGAGRVEQRAWLLYVQGVTPRRGDHVLLSRPDNDPQWLVTAVVGGEPAVRPVAEASRTLRLDPGQRVRIEAHDGTPLLEIGGSANEIVLRALIDDLAVEAAGRLRLAGRGVQIEAGAEGVDIRTDGEAVVRGRHVRIN